MHSTPLAFAICCFGLVGAAPAPVVVTGATGRSGVLIYKDLKNKGVPVRAFVRNVTKAKDLLGCSKCDASEGIFVGDLTEPSTLKAPMDGAGSLVIATSAVPICNPYPKCHFHKGAEPIDIDWNGARAQLKAFAMASGGRGHVTLISTMGLTTPEASTNPFDYIGFYKLNFEAELESSGLPFTIIKPCGLTLEKPGTTKLITGHDDDLNVKPPAIARADLARLTAVAVTSPKESKNLRFDLCSKKGTPTQDEDLVKVLQSARYKWESDPSITV